MNKIVIGFGGTLLLIVAGALAARAIIQRQTAARQRLPIPPGVDAIERIRLGGVEQWIQIRGRSRTLPVLLYLHGGPGFSEMPLAHLNAALADDFVVVQWDQRGAGKSYSPEIPANSMTVEQIVADTRELVLLLRERFHAPKIFLVAHSWGTIIGARAVAQSPELFYAYVAISQVAWPPESERLMYSYALAQAQAAKATKIAADLEGIGPPPYQQVASYDTMKKWIYHFGDAEFQRISPVEFARLIIASPAYSDLDLLRLWRGFQFSFEKLWREAFAIDYLEQIPKLDVPVYFFVGRHDRTPTASAAMAERYFNVLEAPRGKSLVWFDHSGHWPHLSEPQRYRAEVRRILQDCAPPQKERSLPPERSPR